MAETTAAASLTPNYLREMFVYGTVCVYARTSPFPVCKTGGRTPPQRNPPEPHPKPTHHQTGREFARRQWHGGGGIFGYVAYGACVHNWYNNVGNVCMCPLVVVVYYDYGGQNTFFCLVMHIVQHSFSLHKRIAVYMFFVCVCQCARVFEQMLCACADDTASTHSGE